MQDPDHYPRREAANRTQAAAENYAENPNFSRFSALVDELENEWDVNDYDPANGDTVLTPHGQAVVDAAVALGYDHDAVSSWIDHDGDRVRVDFDTDDDHGDMWVPSDLVRLATFADQLPDDKGYGDVDFGVHRDADDADMTVLFRVERDDR